MASTSTSSDRAAALFREAVHAHRAGRIDIAERLYRQVLATDSGHVGTLHYLGIIALQSGHHAAAADLIGRATRLNENLPEPQYHLALALQNLGRLDEAAARYQQTISLKADYAAAHMNLGNIRAQQGRLAEATDCYERVLGLEPNSAVAHYNIANLLARSGGTIEAEARYRAAIACDQNFAEAYGNLGNVLREQERLQDAEAAYARALALRPGYAEAHNNIGIVKSLCGSQADALAHFSEAVRINPSFLDARKNLGLALARCGRSDEALQEFGRVLQTNRDDRDALHHLARELLGQGAVSQAVSALAPALDRNATAETKSLFALAIQSLPPAELDGARVLVGRAIAEGWARGGELERVGVSLVKQAGETAACIARNGSASAAADLPAPLGSADLGVLAKDPLLRQLLISGRVPDVEVERVLTAARSALLGAVPDDMDAPALAFFSALAQQCFINEYVFFATRSEEERVLELQEAITEGLQSGTAIPSPWLLAAGCYAPLGAIRGIERALEQTWPDAVEDVLIQQVRQVLEEQNIRASLPGLTAIDPQSQIVQQQYEENPYPRWITPPPAIRSFSVNDYLRAKFPRAQFSPVSTPGGAEVLIAGCGSGSHAIEAYRRFADARVLAVDLSRASLGYAVRKTRELGLPIDYAQADILRLGDIGRSFDVIEANGSLQCLRDPAAGWRVLLSLLKPGGVMLVGLYSKLAREDINAARALVAARGSDGSPSDIRYRRQEILRLPDGAPGKSVCGVGDFFATSDCRDLLFHVQEYQHTLPEIEAFIEAENLRFLGFLLDPRTLRAYAAANPEDPAMADLARWHRFETAHTAVFAAMYQFAVQKR